MNCLQAALHLTNWRTTFMVRERRKKDIKRILKIIELKGKLFYMKYIRVVLLCAVELIAELYFTYKGGGRR